MKNKIVLSLCLLSIVVFFSGCGGGGGSSSSPKPATVNGRILDANGIGAANADIVVNSDEILTQTNEQGYFSIEIEAGAHSLSASLGCDFLCQRCFTVAEGVTYDLGDLYAGMESNCNLPRDCIDDQDCDGVYDDDETAGWQVNIVLADGTKETRTVTSDPAEYDTDKDGLSDAEEYTSRIDPRRKDTDGDMLSDYGELKVYKSNPSMLDTDGDSCPPAADPCVPDPNLWDGNELFLTETSPTLADTDGDGLSDYQEINSGGTNPRLANLPELSLKLHGNPLLELDVDYQTGTSAQQQELVKEEEEKVDTDTVATKMSIENTIQLHTETKAGTGTWPPSFNAKLTTDTKFHHGYFHDTSSSWKNTSVQESQSNYETWEEENISFADGKLGVAMKITNQSDLSFKVKELHVIAYRLEEGANFTLIGTMLPDEVEWPENGHVLGPGGEFTMTVNRDHIGADMMRQLVRNPMAMMFEVGSYSLFQLDETGTQETVNFSKLGEDVTQRTGIIVIDYGNGDIKRFMVATNVYRNPDGSGRGITLQKALNNVIGLDFETIPAEDNDGNPGKEVLLRVGNVAAWQDAIEPAKRGFWLVGGTGPDFEPGATVDFSDILLRNGHRVNLVYVQDSDGDGIFDREEYLLGTDRTNPDSDGDGLTDYVESKTGWEVAVSGLEPYTVFSDPRFIDPDGDYLSDSSEYKRGTDPNQEDTDGDGMPDSYDGQPLDPPCLDPTFLRLAAWWDGTTYAGDIAYMAEDIMVAAPFADVASDGTMKGAGVPPDPNVMVGPDRFGTPAGAFKFNQSETAKDQCIRVETDASLSMKYDLSLSAWIYWYGPGLVSEWQTLLTKGAQNQPNYAIFVKNDGSLVFRLYRSVHKKCWGWFFGWRDGLCKDSNYNETIDLVTAAAAIQENQWMNITATWEKEKMRIYIDGAEAAVKSTTRTWYNGNKYQTTTNNLITNDSPLVIGLDSDVSPERPYRGALDDLAVSVRTLTPDIALQMSNLRICQPEP